MGTGLNTKNNSRKRSECQGRGGPLCQGPPLPTLSPVVGLLGSPSSAQAGARQRVGVYWEGRKPGVGEEGEQRGPRADAEGRYPLRKRGGGTAAGPA